MKTCREKHPDEQITDGQVFVQAWPAGPKDQRQDQVIYYQYRHDRARRTLRGIDEQVAKAVAGKVAVKRNRFVRLTGGDKSVNRDLEAKTRALAGIKGYVTNLTHCPDGTPIDAEFVIGSYHQLWRIEQSFRMSKHDLQARPIYHHKRELRVDRSVPLDRVHRPRGHPVPRGAHRLVDPQVRPDRPPLPHRHHPGRRPDHHRRRTAPRRSTRRHRQDQQSRRSALI